MLWTKLTEKKPERDQVVLIRMSSGVTEARYVLEECGEDYELGWYFRLHPATDGLERIDECYIVYWSLLPEETKVQKIKKISKGRYADLLNLLEGYEEIARSLMKTYNLKTLADLPENAYPQTCKRIESLKRAHDEYKLKG